MTALQLRKQTLLLESDLNRLALHAECRHLRNVGGRAGCGANVRSAIRPLALLLAPVAGSVAALGLRRSGSGAGLLRTALHIAPSLVRLCRVWFSQPDKSE